ncbi:hypothetical protein [Roseofilum capinflatum]|uniref:DUF2281 domain-containing protein n=1 Tax=Roseofilum capinflatum BLCC-M114 TaxID=3022440 RepID=A0ABT7B7S4_9CYAN|nr:hypothetical protein [Roseofilum capinflatum]MDJ1174664.1 hypothetical protein [Roseofilum capinflatum BLCC-M114]
MTITNLLPQLHDLSRQDKLKLIKFLLQDLHEAGSSNNDAVLLSERDRVLLSQVVGTWTETDEAEFLENTQAFREVDESLWN